MSDGAEVYDAVELRRRIVVCFSIGELQKLAESLGVAGSIAWERGIGEASRDVVRQCERYAGLPALVAKLREVRPLVEWPEPAGGLAPALFPAAPPLAPLPGLPPELPADPANAPAPPLADPFAPAVLPAELPRTIGMATPQPTSAPAPPSPVWPALAAEPAPARGVDPRLLLAVAGLTVLAAVIAYLAGRASGGGPADAASPAASAGVAAARRAEGPAMVAADVIARSLANVARACELPASAGGNVLVFQRVLDRCGPAPTPPRPAAPPAATQPDPNAEPTPDPPGKTRRSGRGGAAPSEPASPSRSCTGACDTVHRACKAGCGPEPTESGGYEGYQRCLGRCLSDQSRCRLSCR